MNDEDEHIINWILDKTDFRNQKEKYNAKKRASAFDQRKHRIDNVIFFCKKCENCWSKVPKWVDIVRWRKYPSGLIPTIGKKRKYCPGCKNV
jgi:hypothetical protein